MAVKWFVEKWDLLEARAYTLATMLNHPVYDCLYLALAEMVSIDMIIG